MPRVEWDKSLFNQKGGQGWPYTIFMDETGEVVAEISLSDLFGSDPKMAVTGAHETAREFVDLRKNALANPKDHDANAGYLMKSLARKSSEAGFKKLTGLMSGGKISEETKKRYAAFKPRYLYGALRAGFQEEANRVGRDRAKIAVLAKKLQGAAYNLYKEGTRLEDPNHRRFPDYWYNVAQGAHAAGDKEGTTLALTKLDTWLADHKDHPRAKAAVDKLRKDVAEKVPARNDGNRK